MKRYVVLWEHKIVDFDLVREDCHNWTKISWEWLEFMWVRKKGKRSRKILQQEGTLNITYYLTCEITSHVTGIYKVESVSVKEWKKPRWMWCWFSRVK